MSTIADRLNIVADMLADEGFRPRMPAEPAAIQLAAMECRKVAAELEAAPAADAVPVVAYLYEDPHDKARYAYAYESTAIPLDPQPCVRQSDHLSAIAALQARIAELQARQVPAGWVAVPRELHPDVKSVMQACEDDGRHSYASAWSAMLAAAHSNPTTPRGDDDTFR